MYILTLNNRFVEPDELINLHITLTKDLIATLILLTITISLTFIYLYTYQLFFSRFPFFDVGILDNGS